MKSLQKDLEDALRRARGDADHFKKQLTEAHRVAMSQASVAASVHAATSQVHISYTPSVTIAHMRTALISTCTFFKRAHKTMKVRSTGCGSENVKNFHRRALFTTNRLLSYP